MERRLADGDELEPAVTLDEVLPEVYGRLRAMAARTWGMRDGGGSLQPTALVHEVYLRLGQDKSRTWRGQAHVLAVAARAMRMVLADRARRRSAVKRGGDVAHVSLTGIGAQDDPIDLIALDAALADLEAVDPRRCSVFVLRALGGLTVDDVAAVLEVSPRTVKSDWVVARAWVVAQLDLRARASASST